MTTAIKRWSAAMRAHGYFACRWCVTRRLYQNQYHLTKHEREAHG